MLSSNSFTKNFLIIAFFNLTLISCSKTTPNNPIENAIKEGIISSSDAKTLATMIRKQGEQKPGESTPRPTFVVLSTKNSFSDLVSKIQKSGSILKSNEKTGLIIFSSLPKTALSFINKESAKAFIIDHALQTSIIRPQGGPLEAVAAYRTDLYPVNIMKGDQLAAKLKSEKNITVDGSSVAIVITDTGLDISRTDVFQDRIMGLRTTRSTDSALVTEADEIQENGKTYLTATIDNKTVKIEKSERLKEQQTYYLGYFSEELMKNASTENLFDFNLDTKLDAIYPVVVFKNASGVYVGYINVNAQEIYGAKGDNSIEDENLMSDFTYASRTLGDNRYVKHPSNAALDYYTNATRMDIISANGKLLSDRKKGRVNLTFNISKGFELDDSNNLLADPQETKGKSIYHIGIAGFDPMGHGTHCAGSTSGNFLKMPQFNAVASGSKIYGVPFLGGGATISKMYMAWIDILESNENVVLSNSWASTMEQNIIETPTAKIYDGLSLSYNAPLLFAASNEGSGIGSHNTNVSHFSFSIGSIYNSDARNVFSADNDFGSPALKSSQNLISSYSSRGPTFDGALKPDFSAPGWVMSSTPLIAPDAMQFWTGTSMATPNAASAIAVLIDGMIKSGLKKPTIDQLHTAIKNTAQKYDQYYAKEIIVDGNNRYEEPEMKSFLWVDGGAGHVDILKSFAMLDFLQKDPPLTFLTETESKIPGINHTASGYFAYDRIERVIPFVVRLNLPDSVEGMTETKTMTFKIPDDVNWLSFDQTENKKVMSDILVTNGRSGKLLLYVRSQELMNSSGKVKPGVHEAIIKGYDNSRPDIFVTTFPVVLIGSATQFSAPIVGEENFSVEGFIQAGQAVRYFIPVASKDVITRFDLNVSQIRPGNIFMHIYKNGVEIPIENLGSRGYRASVALQGQNGSTMSGNTHLVNILQNVPEGVYEVALESATLASWENSYNKNSPRGSHFSLSVARNLVSVEKVDYISASNEGTLRLQNVRNRGNNFLIQDMGVLTTGLKKNFDALITEQKEELIPITIGQDIGEIELTTAYAGSSKEMDIDISLLDSTGKVVETSAGGSADEKIAAQVSPGQYTLAINGYSIANEEKKEKFSVTIIQKFKTPIMLADTFVKEDSSSALEKNSLWKTDQQYSLKANITKSALEKIPSIAEYKAMMFAIIAAGSNDGQNYFVLKKEFLSP